MTKTLIAFGLVVLLIGIILFVNVANVVNSRTAPTIPQDALSDLKTETTKKGSGTRQVKNGDKITVHYVGTLADGTKFDSSRDRKQPFTFTVGSHQVIEGWEEGVIGMKKGEIRKLSIPYSKGYGADAQGSIPPYSDLYFEIELLKFN